MSLENNTTRLRSLLEQANNLPNAGSDNAVLYTEQILTADQKSQARTNIGAASADDVSELYEEIVDLKALLVDGNEVEY